MTSPFRAEDQGLTAQLGSEMIRVEGWGCDALRIRATVDATLLSDEDRVQALLDGSGPTPATVDVRDERATVTNGNLRAELEVWRRSDHDIPQILIRYVRVDSGDLLCAEEPPHWNIPTRQYRRRADGLFEISVRFAAQPGEHFYGLGQHQHGRLDQKGVVVDLVHRNTEVAVPFVLSSRGYGMLWNSPALGRVELGETNSRWMSTASPQVDVWICAADETAGIIDRYSEVVGRAPVPPDWFSGFWQSRLRYASQEQLLDVAHGYRKRGLPLSVLVIDFFHWTRMGEFRFDPVAWPDPSAMVTELRDLGLETMVSVWPTIHPASGGWDRFESSGWLVGNDPDQWQLPFTDTPDFGLVRCTYYDATHPDARDHLWELLEQGYATHGIQTFWLDACEPEMYPEQHDQLRYHAGPGEAVTNAYPLLHAAGVAKGLRARGTTPVLLSRSAWAGGARHGMLVWSGDVPSTFDALRRQIPAALNMGLSGFPWWTCDIGGFRGGNPDDPAFRELLVRWFEFAVFLPVTRLHGMREPSQWSGGASNEPWSFGPAVEAILTQQLALRESLRPEIDALLAEAATTGAPIARPLFWAFPEDDASWTIADEFLVGNDLLVAPVVEAGARTRTVWLPTGTDWIHQPTGERHSGGQHINVDAPLEHIPWFRRA